MKTPSLKIDSLLAVGGAEVRIGPPDTLRGRWKHGIAGGILGETRSVAELLAQSLAGEAIQLEVEALVSLEPVKPLPLPEEMRELANKNFSRFTQRGIRTFVRSYQGRPFLRDHDKHELLARGGRILSSKPATSESGDLVEFRQVLEVVKPWAVQGILDGTIETFSIGWIPKDSSWEGYAAAVSCSVCGCSLLSFDCSHFPGEVVELNDSGERVIVEALWDSRKIAGTETSAVTFPAVAGTRIEDFQQALSEARAFDRENPRMDEIRKLLKLSEDATKAEILAAITKLQESAEAQFRERVESAEGKATELETLLSAEKESHQATQTKLEQAQAELEKAAGEKVDALVERALSEGRIRPKQNDAGEQVTTDIEKAIRLVAERSGLAAATSYVEALPVIDPLGRLETPVEAPTNAPAASRLSEDELSICRQLKLTPEEYLEANPPTE